jgi:hypothetical protein
MWYAPRGDAPAATPPLILTIGDNQ